MTSEKGAFVESNGHVAVIGLGNWGTALAQHLAVRGEQVVGWTVQEEVVRSINEERRNACYLSDVTLHQNLRATGDLSIIKGASLVLIALPSAALEQMIPQLQLGPDSLVVSAVKGLHLETQRTPLQLLELHCPSKRLVVLSGPSFAADVVRQKPCGVVAASKDASAAREVAERFSGSGMRVYISNDPLGVELGGILKNVIAIAVGVCDGLELGDSARAGLITRGLAEMIRLAEAMGADPRTLSGLSGLGDLTMTSTSDLSRNRRVGLLLGKGESLTAIIDRIGSVAEGVRTAPIVLQLAAQYGVDMPITTQVSHLLNGNSTPTQLVERLLSRPLKNELE